jgi:biopolymer transport protein ExbD
MDEAALKGLAAARGEYCMQADCAATQPRLTLRADSRLPAARLAALLPRIAGLGFGQVELAIVPGGGPGPVAGPVPGAGE